MELNVDGQMTFEGNMSDMADLVDSTVPTDNSWVQVAFYTNGGTVMTNIVSYLYTAPLALNLNVNPTTKWVKPI